MTDVRVVDEGHRNGQPIVEFEIRAHIVGVTKDWVLSDLDLNDVLVLLKRFTPEYELIKAGLRALEDGAIEMSKDPACTPEEHSTNELYLDNVSVLLDRLK